ncbi:glycosyltransferase family 1 protein [Photobacterium damselae subsp. damselae]|uniref:glycosyltransferase family 4 protein n=1 Tax=Photobacterium damselae TaxID=38293 RepID=UPI000A2FC14D|nr:glycosyltransferase family 1 protein [Photobacterium damselae]ARR50739.1 mannosyltransferase [Photobacterium damselae subsp. damselae]QAY35582.1 glycosyltransferase family 1 protein [Photobacterium damselae subsp. damselae]
MIIYDDIINSLQSSGGISVYFDQIYKRLNSKEYVFIEERWPKTIRRYIDCKIPRPLNISSNVFHSSYYRLPLNKRIPIVTTVHDFTYEKYKYGPAKWLHCWQKYRAIRNSDIVICVSKNTANDLKQYCSVPDSKIRIIYNGVSESYYPIEDSSYKKNEVLFVGARGGYKNFDKAVQTLSQMPELTLTIIGGGELSNTERKFLDENIPGRYVALGRVSEEELNLLYNRAYALLYPSSYEGFGIPIIEAMKAGCPVVAVRCSSIPEVAGDAAILTDNAEANAFVDALRLIKQDRNEIVVAGIIQAKKFSWDKCFQETLSVYKELQQ